MAVVACKRFYYGVETFQIINFTKFSFVYFYGLFALQPISSFLHFLQLNITKISWRPKDISVCEVDVAMRALPLMSSYSFQVVLEIGEFVFIRIRII